MEDETILTYRRLTRSSGSSVSSDQRQQCHDQEEPHDDDEENPQGNPVVMIHPVGIGMAAWFYDRLIMAWGETTTTTESAIPPPLYAVNLRGCGFHDARDAGVPFDPSAQLQKPSWEEWVNDCAHFLDRVALNNNKPVSASSVAPPPSPAAAAAAAARLDPSRWFSALGRFRTNDNGNNKPRRKCHLVVQGGLAPLGIVLAQRYPDRVQSLTLCSPPDPLEGASPQEIDSNLKQLASPLGNAAIGALLENPVAIRLFSNLFLFGTLPCDAEWVRQANAEAHPLVRPAVQYFNAGGCCQVSADGAKLDVPVLILQGSEDPRTERRSSTYGAISSSASAVQFATLPNAQNVLPWEAPKETAAAIQEFIRQQHAS
jgi:pimeloyl-ACP methyl ester carboxylesterase